MELTPQKIDGDKEQLILKPEIKVSDGVTVKKTGGNKKTTFDLEYNLPTKNVSAKFKKQNKANLINDKELTINGSTLPNEIQTDHVDDNDEENDSLDTDPKEDESNNLQGLTDKAGRYSEPPIAKKPHESEASKASLNRGNNDELRPPVLPNFSPTEPVTETENDSLPISEPPTMPITQKNDVDDQTRDGQTDDQDKIGTNTPPTQNERLTNSSGTENNTKQNQARGNDGLNGPTPTELSQDANHQTEKQFQPGGGTTEGLTASPGVNSEPLTQEQDNLDGQKTGAENKLNNPEDANNTKQNVHNTVNPEQIADKKIGRVKEGINAAGSNIMKIKNRRKIKEITKREKKLRQDAKKLKKELKKPKRKINSLSGQLKIVEFYKAMLWIARIIGWILSLIGIGVLILTAVRIALVDLKEVIKHLKEAIKSEKSKIKSTEIKMKKIQLQIKDLAREKINLMRIFKVDDKE